MKKYKENASFTKKSTAERIVYIVVFVLFFLYAASLLYPFLWGLLSSLNVGYSWGIIRVGSLLPTRFSFPHAIL
ncbi:MAG: hypothetical protein HPZ86_11150, partial [Clostridia bacterium]|nr:hypothetical protein [Clostridia bacterium]